MFSKAGNREERLYELGGVLHSTHPASTLRGDLRAEAAASNVSGEFKAAWGGIVANRLTFQR